MRFCRFWHTVGFSVNSLRQLRDRVIYFHERRSDQSFRQNHEAVPIALARLESHCIETPSRAVSTDILHLPARVVVTAAERLTSADGRNVLEELSGMSEWPMIIPMTTTGRSQQRYDHRLRDLVQGTGDVTIATDLGVPRSTARGWLGTEDRG